MTGTMTVTNEVTKRDFTFKDSENSVMAQGSCETNGSSEVRMLNCSVYAAGGQREYLGNFNCNRQGDGTLHVSYNPQTDDDLDTLLKVKQAVVAEITENQTFNV